eukprot:Clim_evm49s231 gene=Clim_evmTU49s231
MGSTSNAQERQPLLSAFGSVLGTNIIWDRSPHHSFTTEGSANSSDNENNDPLNYRTSIDRGIEDTFAVKKKGKWSTVRKRVRYYLPLFSWITKVRPETMPYDFVAALATVCMLIPQCLAYAHLAHLRPVVGIYSCLVPLFGYTLMGTSPHIVIGPEALISILLGTELVDAYRREIAQNVLEGSIYGVAGGSFGAPPVALSPGGLQAGLAPSGNDIVAEGPEISGDIAMITLLSGVMCFLLGFVRMGYLDVVFSPPLIAGFANAAAITLLTEQFRPLFGLAIAEPIDASTVEKIWIYVRNIDTLDWAVTMYGLGSLAIMTGWRAIKSVYTKNGQNPHLQLIPMPAVVCFLGCLVAWSTNAVERYELPVLGQVDAHFPSVTLPKADVSACLGLASSITLIGIAESLAVAKLYARRRNRAMSPNRELVGLGIANILGSFFGAIPAYGSMPRATLMDAAGGRSMLVSAFMTGMVAVILKSLLPLFTYLPTATMAAIVVSAAIAMFESHELLYSIHMRDFPSFAQNLAVCITTLCLGVKLGIIIGVTVSLLLILKHTTLPKMRMIGRNRQTGALKPITDWEDVEPLQGVLLIRLDEALYFWNTSQLRDWIGRLERYGNMETHPSEKATIPSIEYAVFDVKKVPYLDISGASILLDIVRSYHQKDVIVCFTRIPQASITVFQKSGLLEEVGEEFIFPTIESAINFLDKRGLSVSGSSSNATPRITPGASPRDHTIIIDHHDDDDNTMSTPVRKV